MDFEGKVIYISETETIKNGKEKQNIVVEEIKEEYANSVVVSFMGDKVSQLKGITIGDDVVVGFNQKASEWNGKYFQNNNGRKIKVKNKKEAFSNSDSDLPF